MPKYKSLTQDSALASAEFAPGYAFLQLRAGGEEKIARWLEQNNLAVFAAAPYDGGKMLIANTDRPPQELLSSLAVLGENFTPDIPKKSFDGWKWRGILGLIGQGFDMVSVWRAAQRGTRAKADNAAYFLFSAFNIGAGILNISSGAEKTPDTHRMRYLKAQMNEALEAYAGGQPLPAPHETLTASGEGKGIGGFLRNHAVYSDIALRSFGNLNLVTPVTQWKQPGWKDKLNPNAYTRAGGVSFLAGKVLAAAAKIPDPYNPTPPTAVEKAREKWLFPLSTGMDTLAAVILGYDAFKGGASGKHNPLAGVGAGFFIAGYIARFFAPFGVREVNIGELQAHAAQGLARVPPEKLPQLIADVSGVLKQHLKDQPITYGEIYAQLSEKIGRARAAMQPPPDALPAAEEPKRRAFAPTQNHTERAEKSAPVLQR